MPPSPEFGRFYGVAEMAAAVVKRLRRAKNMAWVKVQIGQYDLMVRRVIITHINPYTTEECFSGELRDKTGTRVIIVGIPYEIECVKDMIQDWLSNFAGPQAFVQILVIHDPNTKKTV